MHMYCLDRMKHERLLISAYVRIYYNNVVENLLVVNQHRANGLRPIYTRSSYNVHVIPNKHPVFQSKVKENNKHLEYFFRIIAT